MLPHVWAHMLPVRESSSVTIDSRQYSETLLSQHFHCLQEAATEVTLTFNNVFNYSSDIKKSSTLLIETILRTQLTTCLAFENSHGERRECIWVWVYITVNRLSYWPLVFTYFVARINFIIYRDIQQWPDFPTGHSFLPVAFMPELLRWAVKTIDINRQIKNVNDEWHKNSHQKSEKWTRFLKNQESKVFLWWD